MPHVEAPETMSIAATLLRRPSAAPARPPFETALLRRSMHDHAARLHRCVHCHRTPLVGEVVHVYAVPAGERMVCELCRPLRLEAPARSQLMHAPEHDRSVRVLPRAA